jgi:hypothetical protein
VYAAYNYHLVPDYSDLVGVWKTRRIIRVECRECLDA